MALNSSRCNHLTPVHWRVTIPAGFTTNKLQGGYEVIVTDYWITCSDSLIVNYPTCATELCRGYTRDDSFLRLVVRQYSSYMWSACENLWLNTRLHWFSQRRSPTPHFWGSAPTGFDPNSNSAKIFVQCTYPWSFIILCLLIPKLLCWQTNKQTKTHTRCWKHSTFFGMPRRWVKQLVSSATEITEWLMLRVGSHCTFWSKERLCSFERGEFENVGLHLTGEFNWTFTRLYF